MLTSSTKREVRALSRSRRVATAKKCTKKRDARTKSLFCQSKPIAFYKMVIYTEGGKALSR